MLLAAATTLVQDPTIRVPDGAANSKGISVQSVLPDWDDKEQSTLLSRPIFAEAIYGAVRFHHRSVREYLAAEWFAELLNREGPAGQAIMDLNKEDGGNRKYIFVQLPEQTDEKSEVFKAGYKKISDITVKRNKRVITRIEQEQAEKQQQGLFEQGHEPYKPGFKVYHLVKSHFPRVEFQPDPDKISEENIALLRQYIVDKEATLYSLFNEADIFDEVMLKNGFQLSYTREQVAEFTANCIYRVSDGHKSALICLDAELHDATVAALGGRDEIFICLERAVDTTKKWNLKHQLGEKLVVF